MNVGRRPKLVGLAPRGGAALILSATTTPGNRTSPQRANVADSPTRPDRMARPLDALEGTIRNRAVTPSEKSYTSRLLEGDLAVLCGKVVEEAAELVEAADEPGDEGLQHFIYEAGDLIYHTLVLLRRRGVDLAEVEAELARRFGISGLEEKAKRG